MLDILLVELLSSMAMYFDEAESLPFHTGELAGHKFGRYR